MLMKNYFKVIFSKMKENLEKNVKLIYRKLNK